MIVAADSTFDKPKESTPFLTFAALSTFESWGIMVISWDTIVAAGSTFDDRGIFAEKEDVEVGVILLVGVFVPDGVSAAGPKFVR